MVKKPRVEFYKSEGGDWCWRLISANGRNVGPGGEGFASLYNAKRAWMAHAKTVMLVEKLDSLQT